MTGRWRLLLALALACHAEAQNLTWRNLGPLLGFENGAAGVSPAGWVSSGGILIDDTTVHSGKFAARIDRTATSSGSSSTLSVAMPMDLAGKTITWRGYIKTERVSDYVGLWMREDGDSPNLAFASMQSLGVKGTTDWTQYSISVPVVADARMFYLGVLLVGAGRAWVDDLELLLDGVAIAKAEIPAPTPLETDRDFDSGSGIALTELSVAQVKNLALLAKVWGFLKYHHPAVASGKRHWDYDLFRVLPRVLAAGHGAVAASVISTWVDSLGPVPECTLCATLDTSNLYLKPDIDWIFDEDLLGAGLSRTLQSVYVNRSSGLTGFYISHYDLAGNPSFDHEPDYPAITLPDAGYQLLALFRYWNMVQYFSPNRDILADDPANDPHYWDNALEDSIPRIALAKDRLLYQQELIRFIAKINDTHAYLSSSLSARPPAGDCQLPVRVRFIEGKALIVDYTSATAGPASELRMGDIIEKLDGVPVEELVARWRPYYAASNESTRLRDIARNMTTGPCGGAAVEIRRGEEQVRVGATRVISSTLDLTLESRNDRPGDTFQKLREDVAYLKLSSARTLDAARYIQAAAGTKGLIIDIRNYPLEFMVFTLGGLLVSRETQFAKVTVGDAANPGAFRWRSGDTIRPFQPRYTGKVVILIDEITQSQAEYTAMAFRTASGAVVIGSTTAGTDGNVSRVTIPGGMASRISGIGIFYPDGRPTQRVGIVPDIEVKPTIAGIRAGRDELVEAAIRVIVGGS